MMANEIVNNGKGQKNEVVIYNPSANIIEMRLDSKRFPRLCRIDRNDAIMQLNQIVVMAVSYKGQQTDTATILMMAEQLYTELMSEDFNKEAKFLCMAEISRAIKKSVLGQGKEMFGVNVASMYAVIIDYVKTEGLQAQAKANQIAKDRSIQQFKQSSVGVMTDVYAAQMVKNNSKK